LHHKTTLGMSFQNIFEVRSKDAGGENSTHLSGRILHYDTALNCV
jgi:hypothetical protein